MFYRPENRDPGLPHDPIKAMVAPRPIGWISTLSPAGIANLAPYSFFNAIGSAPPMLMFASEGRKDTANNAAETGEFVFNYASRSLAGEMNASSVAAPPGVSEFDHLDIEKAASRLVAPPRVAKAFAALECKVIQIVEPVDIDGGKTGVVIVIGQVVGVYIDEAVIRNGRFDVGLAEPVSRLGYLDFGFTDGLHERPRPVWED